jgi:hypothetical protein
MKKFRVSLKIGTSAIIVAEGFEERGSLIAFVAGESKEVTAAYARSLVKEIEELPQSQSQSQSSSIVFDRD